MSEHPIDAPRGPLYVRCARGRWRTLTGPLVAGLLVGSAVAACASARTGSPVPEERADQLIAAAERRGRLDAPVQVVFEWSLNEAGTRLGGRGAARMEPPFQARLDLFTESGETAARAALVGGELRVPPDADRRLIPPPPLLWAALGVFRPGDDAAFLGAEALDGSGRVLRYRVSDDDEVRYEVTTDGVVRGAELLSEGRVLERVSVERTDTETFPVRARYRHLADFRELTVERESVQRVEPHDPGIWRPAR